MTTTPQTTEIKKAKGLLLFSGGLDSMLAAKVLMDQNVDLTGIHFLLPFFSPFEDPYKSEVAELADSIGLKLRIEAPYDEYIKMLKNPKHGYGKNMNPCIDCKILFLMLASKIFEKENYDFIATGEVNGQRPMSQRSDMIKHIEKESGLVNNIIRPLSSSYFPPSIAQQKGLVDSSKLLNINGRSRKEQLALAKKFNIEKYQTPAGGCSFTEEPYAKRLKDHLENNSEVTNASLYLLKTGRHFRLDNGLKIIVSRNQQETEIFEKCRIYTDYYLEADFKGPSALIYGEMDEMSIKQAANLTASYGKPDTDSEMCLYKKNELLKIVKIEIVDKSEFSDYRIV